MQHAYEAGFLALCRAKTPPYTGYGSWDDSMGSVTHLIPKQPKKDQKSRGLPGRETLRGMPAYGRCELAGKANLENFAVPAASVHHSAQLAAE